MKSTWKGVFPAMVTPFAGDGTLDKSQLNDLVDLLLSEGVAGLVVGGSTGEYYSMTAKDRIELFSIVKRRLAGKTTLIAGTSSINHSETVMLTKEAKSIGYDGCMVLPPVYSLPTPAEIQGAFEEVASIGLPIMIYNNPARAGVGLTPDLAEKLSKIDKIVAYKESARDLYVISEIFYRTRERISLFAGLEPYGSALLSRGAVGLVSTISNVCASVTVGYYDAYQKRDADTLSRLQQVIDELYHLLARSRLSNYAFVKSAMMTLGRPGGVPRRPHHLADRSDLEHIAKEIKAIYERADIQLPRS